MSFCNQVPKSSKFRAHRSLIITSPSPLPRPPGCLGSSSTSCPESSSEGCFAGRPVESLESYLDGNSASCSERSSESYRASCGESRSPSCSADCPAICPESSPESKPPGNPASNLPGNSESYWEGCPACCLGNPRCSSVKRSDLGGSLLQLDDLADSLSLRLCLAHEVHSRRQRPHIIRPGSQV
jgi:hypothetical protein